MTLFESRIQHVDVDLEIGQLKHYCRSLELRVHPTGKRHVIHAMHRCCHQRLSNCCAGACTPDEKGCMLLRAVCCWPEAVSAHFMASETLLQTANLTALSSACAAYQAKGPAPDTQNLACISGCVLPSGHVMESMF